LVGASHFISDEEKKISFLYSKSFHEFLLKLFREELYNAGSECA
jgi:hypothetical protein